MFEYSGQVCIQYFFGRVIFYQLYVYMERGIFYKKWVCELKIVIFSDVVQLFEYWGIVIVLEMI